jgi:hypothetical protein
MRNYTKKLMGVAAVMALVGAVTCAPASAADRLTVKNSSSAVVFNVDDSGTVTAPKVGLGASAPQAPLHLHVKTGAGVATDPGTVLYSVSTGFAGTAQDNSFAQDFVVADGTSTAGMVGGLRGVRARGTLAVPAVPLTDDLVLSLVGGLWDGGKVYNAAQIAFKVDGPVSTSVAPQRIVFNIRNNGTGAYVERLTVKANGNVGISTPVPTSRLHVTGLVTYTSNANAIAAGLTAGAFYTDGVGNVKVVY